MSADYLVASLPTLSFEGPAPCSLAEFDALCREQLGADPFKSLSARWADIDAQLRNAIAAERARARGEDVARWQRPTVGISLHYRRRVTDAFRETAPERRDELLDRIRWDAAGELTPPSAPLSAAAAFTYRIRLEIAIKRSAIRTEAGNEAFNRIAAAAEPARTTEENGIQP